MRELKKYRLQLLAFPVMLFCFVLFGFVGSGFAAKVTKVSINQNHMVALTGTESQNADVGGVVEHAPGVLVKDTFDNPISGVEVTFTVTAGNGSITEGSTSVTEITKTTDAQGIACVGGWRLGAAAGSNSMNAANGKFAGSPITFTAESLQRTLTVIGNITGTARVGETLTAGALTPSTSTATYQWQSSDTASGTYADINGATNSTYTLVAGDVGKYIKVVATGTTPYTGTVTSAATSQVGAKVISIAAIGGVTAPVAGATPVTTITATDQYTGSVTWKDASSNTPTVFLPSTVYTATITLTAKSGYTLTGVTADRFTVSGSTSDTNPVNSGVITVAFPATVTQALTGIGAITGTARVGETLTAGALTPSTGTATYQWQSSDTASGTYADISGATNSTYTLVAGDVGKYIKVVATGSGNYTGTVASAATSPVGVALLKIGDSYGGGIVAYILKTGETIGDISADGTSFTTISYESNVQHGLIAATNDQSTGTKWSNIDSTANGATGSALGAGASNTSKIINQSGHIESAAKICADYSVTVGGATYDDWFLPSRDELIKLYDAKSSVGGFVVDNGALYWSSSEFDAKNARLKSFLEGTNSSYGLKTRTDRVRAVRAF